VKLMVNQSAYNQANPGQMEGMGRPQSKDPMEVIGLEKIHRKLKEMPKGKGKILVTAPIMTTTTIKDRPRKGLKGLFQKMAWT
jgi:hypothetical protein